MPALKISGITNEDDARWAAILGVEYVSVSFITGDARKTSDDMAGKITEMLPSYTEVILEMDAPEALSQRRLEKISPTYLSVPFLPDEAVEFSDSVLSLRKIIKADKSDESEIIQIEIREDIKDKDIEEITLRFNGDSVIIEGDFSLSRIKEICRKIQPRAWSLRSVISKSPRRIDYPLMKEYIREISLW